ncbi:MAG: ATP-dependent zinc metalloprotease FtsH [Clostridiales bacterium]|nr:ATP-dependent zinc metalloprotease FtsH [Clostridiales bacterium]
MMLILLALVYTTFGPNVQRRTIYSDVMDMFAKEEVESFRIDGNKLYILKKDAAKNDPELIFELYDVTAFMDSMGDTIRDQHERGIIKSYDIRSGWAPPWWFGTFFYVLVIGGMFYFWYSMMAKQGGGPPGVGKFGKARTRLGSEEKKKTTFADVAGCEEEKEELAEVVRFLKNPKSFTDMGARIPKGVLLVGPPGTGKTLLARAVAGESGVQFLTISGSDFVELYVGVGASRVRDLFNEAKKVAPAIVFIDEIDAVGRQRGSGLGGGHDEREQTLNQLLVEMDGFSDNEGVIVMAATNRADILDNALLRPGRFDRTVYVGLPDVRGREAILKVHARGKRFAETVDFNSIARGTPGFSGADLENLLNEAALMAVANKKRFIGDEEIEEAIRKQQMGPEKKSRIMSDRAKKLTAYHEAGHAISSHFLENTPPVHYITIIPRGPSGGATYFRPEEDVENFESYSELYESIIVSLGGRTAEKLFLDDISTGATNDIQYATRLVRAMVTQYGMSEALGPISFDSADHSIFIGRDFGQTKSYSEDTAALIDSEVKRIFDMAGADCERILKEHEDKLVGVAEYLLKYERMDGEDFRRYCDEGILPEPKKEKASDEPAVSEISEEAKKPEAEEIEVEIFELPKAEADSSEAQSEEEKADEVSEDNKKPE